MGFLGQFNCPDTGTPRVHRRMTSSDAVFRSRSGRQLGGVRLTLTKQTPASNPQLSLGGETPRHGGVRSGERCDMLRRSTVGWWRCSPCSFHSVTDYCRASRASYCRDHYSRRHRHLDRHSGRRSIRYGLRWSGRDHRPDPGRRHPD
jgi:hypothetical protein